MTREWPARPIGAARRGRRQWRPSATLGALVAVATVATVTLSPLGAAAGPATETISASALARSDRLVSPVLVAGTEAPTAPQGAVTVSPEPGSATADPKTQISFLGRPAAALGTVTVSGSVSGVHAGTLEPYSTGNGASFVPSTAFVPGETVTVTTALPIVGATDGSFSFTVAETVPLLGPVTHPIVHTGAPGVQHFASTPKLAPPAITVSADRLSTSGYFLLAPKGAAGQAGPMIVTPSGQLVWFRPLHGDTEAFDLNVQRYAGQPVLTWFQGRVVAGHGEGEGIIANAHYQTVAVVHAGNGLQADLHEFQLTPQGTALISAYRTMRWDTSADGGISNGIVFDGVVQEIDVKTGLVMLEWDSLDHVPVSASDFRAPKSPTAPFDYFHINAIQALAGGDLLVTSRNASAAFEVDPAADGAVLLTLGGKSPSVKMGAGTTFWYEHDVELRPHDRFTVFDDGAAPEREPASRALTLQLDPAAATVSLVNSYSEHGVLGAALGNVELLGNGDEVIGWGTEPEYSVISRDGALLYQASLPSNVDSYRQYLRSWTGRPTTLPAAVLLAGGRVAMSWNGETGIARWRVLTGATSAALRVAVTVNSAGYQTLAPLTHPAAVVEVQALDAAGHVLGTSAALAH